jgi:hypothetical protein
MQAQTDNPPLHWTLGLAQITLGFLAVCGLVIVDVSVRRVDWSAPGTWVWVAVFTLLCLSGLVKLWLAYNGRYRPSSLLKAEPVEVQA